MKHCSMQIQAPAFVLLFVAMGTIPAQAVDDEIEPVQSEIKSAADPHQSSIEFVLGPLRLTDSGFKGGAAIHKQVDVCEGECTFLVSFGNQWLFLTKNTSKEITEVDIISNELRKEPGIEAINLEDIFDLTTAPIVQIGNRSFGFFGAGKSIQAIVEVNQASENESEESGLSRLAIEDGETNCTTKYNVQIRFNEIDQGDSFYISWDECSVMTCEDGTVEYFDCARLSKTIPLEEEEQ